MGRLVGAACALVGAGVLALVPGWAATAGPPDGVPRAPAGGAHRPAHGGVRPAPRASGNVSVIVAPVVFTAELRVVHGLLRTPVLITPGEPSGVATLLGRTGERPRCSVELTPGKVSWVLCSVPAGQRTAVLVTLRDGRTFVSPTATGS